MTQPDPIPYQMSEVPTTDATAAPKRGGDLVSLITGIVALLCVLLAFLQIFRILDVLIGLACGLVAIITGHIAYSRRKTGRGMAVAGLVLGYSAVVLLILALAGAVVGRVALHRRFPRRFFP